MTVIANNNGIVTESWSSLRDDKGLISFDLSGSFKDIQEIFLRIEMRLSQFHNFRLDRNGWGVYVLKADRAETLKEKKKRELDEIKRAQLIKQREKEAAEKKRIKDEKAKAKRLKTWETLKLEFGP